MGHSHNAKYKLTCNTKADVTAAFGNNLPRQIRGSERASFWGNPLQGGATKSITVVGLGADRNGTRKLRLHAKIADKVEQMFQKIKQVNQDYVIYSCGSLCVRYMKNSGTRNSIRDGANYAAARTQHGSKWASGWSSLALHHDNGRNAVQWTKVSNHSFGTAVDINPSTNPYKAGKPFDIPKWMVAIFRDFGFGWGGYYHDYMHFEYEQKDVSPTAATTTPTPGTTPSPQTSGDSKPDAGAPAPAGTPPPAGSGNAAHCTKCGKEMREGTGTTPGTAGATTPPGAGAAGKSNCKNPIAAPPEGYGQAAAVDNTVEAAHGKFYFFKDDYKQAGCPNRTMVYVPKGYVPQDNVDIWTHFHGLNRSNVKLEGYVTKHKLDEMHRGGNKNVIFAMSRGGRDARIGNNCKPGGYRAWVQRIIAFLCEHGPYKGQKPGIGNMIASGHSAGGYVGMTKLMTIGDLKSQLREYIILDGLYVGASTVINFVKANPEIMVRSLGTTHNPPHKNSEQVTRAVKGAKNWQHTGHVKGINHGNVCYKLMPDVLKASCFVDIGVAAPAGNPAGAAGTAGAAGNAGASTGGSNPSFPPADPSKLPTPHCGKPPHIPQHRPKGRPKGWEEFWTCGPTSCQMAIRYFKPAYFKDLSDFDLMMKLCEIGGVTKKGSSLGKNRKLTESSGLKTEHSTKGDKNTVSWIQGKLQAGCLVVLSGNLRTRPWKRSEGKSSGHFMLIIGMNEKSEFVIHDPGGYKGMNKIMNAEQLNEYITSGADRSGRQLAILQP